METISKWLSIIAYYLSEYDLRAIRELGYKTRAEAFKDISIKLGRDNNYLKLRRDEFDVLTSSPRNGWRNRPVANDVQEMYQELSTKSYEEITVIVKKILDAVDKNAKVVAIENANDNKYVFET